MDTAIAQRSTLLFLFAAFPSVLLSTPLLASEAEIEQGTGSNNHAEIVQENAPQAEAYIYQDTYGNNALIIQSGPAEDILSASITQWGTHHTATIEQNNVETRAIGEVIQGGSGNSVDAVQTGVRSVSFAVRQAGNNNTASIHQERLHSIIDIGQVGDDHYARVEQVGDLFTDRVSIYQGGSRNSIEILQEAENGGTVISHQIGSNNSTWVHQRIDNPPIGVEAILTTEGDNNVVVVDQVQAWLSTLTLTQTGDNNSVAVDQGGEGADLFMRSMNSNHNYDDIQLDGQSINVVVDRENTDYSRIDVVHTGSYSGGRIEQYESDRAVARVSQGNNFDTYAFVHQSNAVNAEAYISHDYNSLSDARIRQTSVTDTTAEIWQGNQSGGRSLIATIYQTGGTEGSLGLIEQFGSQNEASIRQDDITDSSGFILQDGMDNVAELIMEGGSGNHIGIRQVGNGHSSSMYQGGTNNTALVSQM